MTLSEFYSLRSDLAELGARTDTLRLNPADIADLLRELLETTIRPDAEVPRGGLGLT